MYEQSMSSPLLEDGARLSMGLREYVQVEQEEQKRVAYEEDLRTTDPEEYERIQRHRERSI